MFGKLQRSYCRICKKRTFHEDTMCRVCKNVNYGLLDAYDE